jgi:hypothetical protein
VLLCPHHPPGFAGGLLVAVGTGEEAEGGPEPAATPEARTRARPMGLARGWGRRWAPTLQALRG